MPDEPLTPRQRAADTKKRQTRERLDAALRRLYIDISPAQDRPVGLKQIADEAGFSMATLYGMLDSHYSLLSYTVRMLLEPLGLGLNERRGYEGNYLRREPEAIQEAYVTLGRLLAGHSALVLQWLGKAWDVFPLKRDGDKGPWQTVNPDAINPVDTIMLGMYPIIVFNGVPQESWDHDALQPAGEMTVSWLLLQCSKGRTPDGEYAWQMFRRAVSA